MQRKKYPYCVRGPMDSGVVLFLGWYSQLHGYASVETVLCCQQALLIFAHSFII